jgi:hypothetical protein
VGGGEYAAEGGDVKKEEETLRIEYDDDGLTIIEKVNEALKNHGLSFETDDEPYDGFQPYKLVVDVGASLQAVGQQIAASEGARNHVPFDKLGEHLGALTTFLTVVSGAPVNGCPRHPGGDRACVDYRCLQTWTPEGAPTPDEQLRRWAAGDSVCPNTRHECCPDFSCCKPQFGWPLEKRAKFVAAGQGEREKMMMGALGDLIASTGEKAHVTRGDPTDHE